MKRSSKVVILAAQQSVNAFSGILVAAYLSRTLDATDLGTYRQVMLPNTIAQPLLILGLPVSLLYFISSRREQSSRVLSANLLLLVSIGVLWAAFLSLGGYSLFAKSVGNPQLTNFTLVAALSGLASIATASFAQCLYATDRHAESAAITVAATIANVTTVVVAFSYFGSIFSILLAQLAVALVAVPIRIYRMFHAVGGSFLVPAVSDLRAQLVHGIDLGFASVIGNLHKEMDKLIVAFFASPSQFAIFTNGAREVPLIGVVQGSVTSVILPDMTRYFADNDAAKAHSLWVKATKKVALILFPITALLLCFSEEIVVLVFSEKYLASVPIFSVYVLLLPLRSISYGSVLIAAGRNSVVRMGATIGFVANVAVTVVLVALIGPLGAAVATVSTVALLVMPWYLIQIAKVFGLSVAKVLPWTYLIAVAAASSALYFAAKFAAGNLSLKHLI